MTRPRIEDVKPQLHARADELAAQLLPQGHRDGMHWVDANRARGGLGDSMKVTLTGPRRGYWNHYASGEHGDCLALIGYVERRDPKAALAWAIEWLGMDGAMDEAELVRRRADASRRAREYEVSARVDREEKRKKAQALWLAAEPRLSGTPAAAYLAGRGIDLGRLGRQPRALRFHPACWHYQLKEKRPAMVAAIAVPGQGHVATHRTYLVSRGDGWDRLRGGDGTGGVVPDGKLSMGRFADCGGWIGLWRGASGKPITQAPAGSAVVVTEGIEDGLTAALAAPDLRVICAVSIANMANLSLPDAITQVTLVADNDGDNKHAMAGLERAVTAHRAAGRRVLVARPPEGVKDINDLARESP